MIMMEPGLMMEIVEQRQAYLRSLGAQRPGGPIVMLLREAWGGGMIRFGRWVEGRCPDVVTEPPVTAPWRSVRPADGAH